MKAEDVMHDIMEYMEYYYPQQCRACEIQQYLNSLKGYAYDVNEVFEFMNYWSENKRPSFEKEVINGHAYFRIVL